ncbi:MAG: carbohydrate porin [Gammaproteobacteria bacterium]|nr:carbohydrate porin [Gammaproteobacteria bacterium]
MTRIATPPGGRADRAARRAALTLGLLLPVALAAADPAAPSGPSGMPPPASGEAAPGFALHGQSTFVEQATDSFRAPYAGPNSLSPHIGRETFDASLFAGWRPWHGAELWVEPEIDQGFGLDGTVGAAGFPSGEAYKVGQRHPYLRWQRAFFRDTIALGGPAFDVRADATQLPERTTANRLVFTVGKFSVTDLFDDNAYAHDPRMDFLNWSLIDASTFDYAADAWGYTVGAAVEWYQGSWTLRGGVFDLSTVPNSAHLDPGMHEFQMIGEIDRREHWFGRTGRVSLTAFQSRARMGLLDAAVQLAQSTGAPVDIAAVRHYRGRFGASLAIEQSVANGVGVFARIGKAAGNVETYEFTDADRTVSAGVSIDGTHWHRGGDTIGAGFAVNGISAARERFLAAGGLGLLVGDGRLPHPATERIVETYYSAALGSHTHAAIDYQRIVNPGYNRDRGPVSVFALRLHVAF